MKKVMSRLCTKPSVPFALWLSGPAFLYAIVCHQMLVCPWSGGRTTGHRKWQEEEGDGGWSGMTPTAPEGPAALLRCPRFPASLVSLPQWLYQPSSLRAGRGWYMRNSGLWWSLRWWLEVLAFTRPFTHMQVNNSLNSRGTTSFGNPHFSSLRYMVQIKLPLDSPPDFRLHWFTAWESLIDLSKNSDSAGVCLSSKSCPVCSLCSLTCDVQRGLPLSHRAVSGWRWRDTEDRR